MVVAAGGWDDAGRSAAGGPALGNRAQWVPIAAAVVEAAVV